MDQAGVICTQEGIFRVNCMDCLDRTNVVQAAIARVVMEKQVYETTIVLWLYELYPVLHWQPYLSFSVVPVILLNHAALCMFVS